jgi:hypothetical protein
MNVYINKGSNDVIMILCHPPPPTTYYDLYGTVLRYLNRNKVLPPPHAHTIDVHDDQVVMHLTLFGTSKFKFKKFLLSPFNKPCIVLIQSIHHTNYDAM